MCMVYKGIEYDYAFEFTTRVSYKNEEENFRIVISKFQAKTGDFLGLCLENELATVSDKRSPFEAFVEIIDETVDITTSSIITYTKAHDGRIPRSRRKVEDENFISKFDEHKKSASSLRYKEQLQEYYDQINEHLIRPENIVNVIYEELEPDFNDYLFLTFFRFLLCAKLPQINNMKLFPI